MKIAVVSPSPVPYTFGGMDRLLEGVTRALNRSCEAELVTLPCDERNAEGIARGYYDFYNLDLSAYDAVISTKAPSYMVQHPVHLLYLCHRMRVFYDQWEARDLEHTHMRRMVQWLDNWAMAPERIPRILTIGRTVSRRVSKWGGMDATPLHLPSTLPAAAPEPGRYLFAAGRLHSWKRMDLAIRGVIESGADIRLKIAGQGPQQGELESLAGGDPRIEFLGHVEEGELSRLYAQALAVIFPPVNEDLGLVTFEAFQSGKPVLTVNDSGEPAEIVTDGETGWIGEPSGSALAERIAWIDSHRDEVAAMEPACLAAASTVTWDGVADGLLESIREIQQTRSGSVFNIGGQFAAPDDGRTHLLVTDNQMIDPPTGGGRIRIWELYRHLPDDFVTIYVGTHDHPGPLFRDQWMAPNFREIVTPLTVAHFRLHEIWRRMTGGDATIDVTMPLLLRFSPRYRRLIERHLTWAHILICSHPWMTPWLPRIESLPFVYDSHNCETAVKGALLRRTAAGRYLARRVRQTEQLTLRRAELTLACSPMDAELYRNDFGVKDEKLALTPNGVDCERFQPAGDEEKKASAISLGFDPARPLGIFVGSNYPPNCAAVEFIATKLAPQYPGVDFAIAGGAGPAWREVHPEAGIPPNCRVMGFVEAGQLDALYRAARFGINPMMAGSGTNIKMLDFMAAGLTILTTPIGARGIAGEDGTHWRLVELGEFAPVLNSLLGDADQAAALGRDARALAEAKYDWRAIAGKLAENLRLLRGADRP